jgi:hypothetical protein
MASSLSSRQGFVFRGAMTLCSCRCESQLVYMRHFAEPLTALNLGAKLKDHLPRGPETYHFLEALHSRLCAPRSAEPAPQDHVGMWKDATLKSVLRQVREAKSDFFQKARDLRMSWNVGRIVSRALEKASGGRKGKDGRNQGLVEAMSSLMRGRDGKEFVGKVG